jgi:hypothetical protein
MSDQTRSSQLARVAARVLASGSTGVDFVVHHTADGVTPWARALAGNTFDELDEDMICRVTHALQPVAYTLERGSGSAPGGWLRAPEFVEADDGHTRGEFHYAHAGGVSTFVATRASYVHRVRAAEVSLADDGGQEPFKGRTVLNPGFLYDDARHLEILLTAEPGKWRPTLADSRMSTRVVRELAHAAADTAKAPILFLQYPAAPFEHRGGSHGGVRFAVGASLRMSVALDETHPERRINFLTEVSKLARRDGFELRIGDSRSGRVRGEWVLVCRADRAAYRRQLTGNTTLTQRAQAINAVPVTFVGPARAGSALAITRMLEERRIGVLGVAISALQEVAFISFLLCLRLDDAGGPFSPAADMVRRTVRELASRCDLGDDTQRAEPAELPDSGKAGGYVGLIGDPAPVDLSAADTLNRYALWVMWNLREEVGHYALLLGLEAVAARTGRQETGRGRSGPDFELRVEYARGRVLDDDTFRGRAKVSVRLPDSYVPTDLKVLLTDLSHDLEDDLRSLLSRKFGSSPAAAGPGGRDLGVRVEWRERWLGPWNPPR